MFTVMNQMKALFTQTWKTWKICSFYRLTRKFLSTTTDKESKQYLEDVGKFDLVRSTGRYPAGQCFLHKTFAYRGIILFPWKAKIIDHDNKNKNEKVDTYYQVLVDERDLPHVNVQTDMNNFVSKGSDRWTFSIPGLDHVPHKDVIPFKPTSVMPISHSFFDRYFTIRPLKGRRYKKIVPKLRLQEWRRKHIVRLHQTKVHKMTTDQIKIGVIAFYLGRRRLSHWWKYSVRIENKGKDVIVFQGQRWGIYLGNGELKNIKGIGIGNKLPVLSKYSPAVQFSSLVSLMSPGGHMWGYYLIQRQADGRTFLCPVPSFPLVSTLARSPLKTIRK